MLAVCLLAALYLLVVSVESAAARSSFDMSASSILPQAAPAKAKPKRKVRRIRYAVEMTYSYKHNWTYDHERPPDDCDEGPIKYRGRGGWSEQYDGHLRTQARAGYPPLPKGRLQGHDTDADVEISIRGSMVVSGRVREQEKPPPQGEPDCGEPGDWSYHFPNGGCGRVTSDRGVVQMHWRRSRGHLLIAVMGYPKDSWNFLSLVDPCVSPVIREWHEDLQHLEWAPMPYEQMGKRRRAWSARRTSAYERCILCGNPLAWPYPTAIQQRWSISFVPLKPAKR